MASTIVPIHLRWSDMDVFHHINNVAYATYMEMARTVLLESNGFTAVNDEVGHMVVRNEIDYVWQLEYKPEPVDMEIWIESVGRTSYVIAYEMRDDNQVYMRAKTTMVCMDMQRNRPGRLTDEMRELLESLSRD